MGGAAYSEGRVLTHPTPQPAPRVRSSQSLWLFSIQPSFPDMKGPDTPPPPRSSQKACLRLARGGSPETPSWASHHNLAPGAGTAPNLASLHCILRSILSWNECIGWYTSVDKHESAAGNQGPLGSRLNDRVAWPTLLPLCVAGNREDRES